MKGSMPADMPIFKAARPSGKADGPETNMESPGRAPLRRMALPFDLSDYRY